MVDSLGENPWDLWLDMVMFLGAVRNGLQQLQVVSSWRWFLVETDSKNVSKQPLKKTLLTIWHHPDISQRPYQNNGASIKSSQKLVTRAVPIDVANLNKKNTKDG